MPSRVLVWRLSPLVIAVVAAAGAAPDRHPLTVDDLWAIPRVGAPAPSPDGAWVVYPVTIYDMEENRGNADLWLVATAAGAPIPGVRA